MSDVQELDAKLRERGRRKLRDELDRIFEPVYQRASGAGNPPLAHTAEGSKIEAPDTSCGAIEAARVALELALLPQYQQQEIDAFVDRVDGLKKQIDELDPRLDAR